MSGTGRTLRVLVVDDSAFNRKTISELLEAIPNVRVVGKAADGAEALRWVAELGPDLITLDLEMPGVDGFHFLRMLMARQPTPVIVISGHSSRENVFRALEMGAIDFIAKPVNRPSTELVSISASLVEKIEVVRHLTPTVLRPDTRSKLLKAGETVSTMMPAIGRTPSSSGTRAPAKIVVIGASTGGPTALLEVFGRLAPEAPLALVVAQHMPEKFTATFAQRLGRVSGFHVAEAEHGQRVVAGRGYVCPGGSAIELARAGADLVIRVLPPDATDRYIPSVDRLFVSTARAAGSQAVGIILTGMGDDGAVGVRAIAGAGGRVLAESDATAVVYGMPEAALRTGCVERALPLPELAATIARII